MKKRGNFSKVGGTQEGRNVFLKEHQNGHCFIKFYINIARILLWSAWYVSEGRSLSQVRNVAMNAKLNACLAYKIKENAKINIEKKVTQ